METTKVIVSDVGAIKRFFESGIHGRKVEVKEMQKLSKEERTELGSLCRIELTKK